MKFRITRGGTWRRPPTVESGHKIYLLTAACYEHQPIIGFSPQRIAQFESDLLTRVNEKSKQTFAHVILPNHYHLIVETSAIKPLKFELGKLHGANSFLWNREENQRGRKVFHGIPETVIKSERHFWAAMNYVHNNPVRHEYVRQWRDWPFTSAHLFLESMGRDKAKHLWNQYPVDKFGDGWDDD